MAGDVGSAKHLATYVAGDFTLMPDHVGTQAVFGGKSRCAGRYLALKRPLCRVDVFNVTAEMIWPGEAFATDGADVGLVHTTVVRAHMVGHAVLPLEALVADGTLERLLVRV